MKILALEFSSQLRSAAVAELSGNRRVNLLGSAEESDFRGVTGLVLIDRALDKAGLKPAEISLVGVGLGPGSYTGVRSAIALAQGWQLGREVKVVGVRSTLCLAEQARQRGISGEVTVIVDAQRGDVYLERYRLSPHGRDVVEPLRIIPVAAIPGDAVVIGPEASKFVPGANDLFPTAEMLAALVEPRLAAPAEQLEPVYLRETTFLKAPPPRQIRDKKKE
jgi:tRNA threonylcarbamoyladenosine biosynthesis protein TsaB